MKIASVYVRFFRSFNIDYLRKSHPDARRFPWELIGEDWQPYVNVPLDASITAILGANESGKSHLLNAIESALTGIAPSRSDFCRYSDYYTIATGTMRYPDFGVELRGFNESEREKLRQVLQLDDASVPDVCYLFREGGETTKLWLDNDQNTKGLTLDKEALSTLQEMLPAVFKIDAEIPLPVSVPIAFLSTNSPRPPQALPRWGRFTVLKILEDDVRLRSSDSIDAKDAQAIVKKIRDAMAQNGSRRLPQKDKQSLELARALLLEVADIDPKVFEELEEAIAKGRDGHVDGIVAKINQAIAVALNFPATWTQDSDFELLVSPRDHDLAFTIRDRTGSQYSFAERSSGLQYFLSYYVQYLVHRPPESRSEVLLMDEPDAYLSSLGQQDLLKILSSYVSKSRPDRSLQAVYVTHSPYLIDRNHAERVRVLEKGMADEGTRVVKDASNNHYEPMRSALGPYVAETVFMGHANLIVEGTSDQVLLVGMSNYLRSRGSSIVHTLDLNSTTIVPAGSASEAAYLTYLARGRGGDKPAVVVLLDSDQDGDDAKRLVLRDGLRGKQLLKESFIFQVADLEQTEVAAGIELREIEDLLPTPVVVAALNRYTEEFLGGGHSLVTPAELEAKLGEIDSMFNAARSVMKDRGLSLNKVGFARCVVDELPNLADGSESQHAITENFAKLIGELGTRLRTAVRETQQIGLSRRISREVDRFIAGHKNSARREEVAILFERLQGLLDNDEDSDLVRNRISDLERKYVGHDGLTEPVDRFAEFIYKLKSVEYVPTLAAQERAGL